jgi:hypothetical protein
LTWRESLRDIEATLGTNANRLYAMGLRHAPRSAPFGPMWNWLCLCQARKPAYSHEHCHPCAFHYLPPLRVRKLPPIRILKLPRCDGPQCAVNRSLTTRGIRNPACRQYPLRDMGPLLPGWRNFCD